MLAAVATLAGGYAIANELRPGGLNVAYAERVADAAARFADWRSAPDAPFSNGEQAFEKILDTLRSSYVDSGLTDDELYRAASQGVLEHIDPARSAWNKLMTPTNTRS